jgi:hypothetical protein
MVYDNAGSKISLRAFTQDFHDLNVEDGHVKVSFVIHDMAGNEAPQTLLLKVDDHALRRLENLSFFAESGSSYAAELDQMNAEARQMLGLERELTID